MDELDIAIADPRIDDVRALVVHHLEFGRSHSTPQDAHALEVDGLLDPAVTLFGIRSRGELIAIGALKRLDDQHAELKTMHTVEHVRGQGIGRAMLDHLLAVARERKFRTVSLETGAQEAFAPARSLYVSAGFAPCEPFGDYRSSPNSTYMTMRVVGIGASVDLRVMETSDLDGAVRVWQAANIARAKRPSPERVARVAQKLQEPTATPYVAANDAGIVGMALLEPCRAEDGTGAVVPNALHISMVFVDPPSQRQGIGSRLMRYALDRAHASGISSVSLWTDCENAGARKLYEALGMKPTRTRQASETVEWVRYELDLTRAQDEAAGRMGTLIDMPCQ